nr:reverse transcriptase domain-containing protein [Tanacetum cinerariifolium]
ADLGASINLMPLSVWEGLLLSELTPTCMTLELADRSVSKPLGIAKDVSFKVGVFHFPADFVVVDFEPDPRVLLILGRCFLKTSRALIDVHKGELTLRIGNEAITYNWDQTVRYSANYNQMTANKIDVVELAREEYSQEVLGFSNVTDNGTLTPQNDPIVFVTSPTLTPFGDSDFLLFEEADAFLGLEDDPDSPKINPFYYDPEGEILLLEAILNKVKLKDLPHHLEYAFLEVDDKLPVIIAKELRSEEKSALIKVLKSYKRAIAWKLSDIQGINPEFCTHKILMEENYKPAVQHQRRAYEAKTVKSSIEEPPEVKLKDLPHHLEYAFMEGDNKLPVIIVKELRSEEKAALIKVLKSHKRAIAWKLFDIQGIYPEFYTHKILMEEDYKPAVQHQRKIVFICNQCPFVKHLKKDIVKLSNIYMEKGLGVVAISSTSAVTHPQDCPDELIEEASSLIHAASKCALWDVCTVAFTQAGSQILSTSFDGTARISCSLYLGGHDKWDDMRPWITAQVTGHLGICNPSSNPTSSTNLNSKGRNRRRSKQRIKNFNLDDLSPPIVTMADQRTMAQLLQAPTEGYVDAIVVLEITANNFELKHGLLTLVQNKQFFRHDKKDPRAHVRYFNKINSTLKFLNVPNMSIKLMLFLFSLEGAARIWLEKESPRSIFTWDDLVSKFINHEAWDRFKDLLRACPHHGFSELHQLDTFYNALNSKDQDSLNSAAGGNFLEKMPRECLAIIESKSKVCYSCNKPVVSKVSTNTSTSSISPDVAKLKDMVKALLLDKKSQNQSLAPVKGVVESCVTCSGAHSYRNCPATDGNVYRDNIQEFVSQASTVNYNQGNTSYRPSMMSNQIRPLVMRNMQNQLTNLTDLITKFVNSNSASTSSSCTLPSNIISNPKSELKAITTRSGVSYDGPQITHPPSFLLKMVENEPEVTKDTVNPNNNGITEDVQPQVVQSESLILISKPITSPIFEPAIAQVTVSKPNPKASIPYPSWRNDERNHEKANNQIEKFYQILKDMSFEISFVDALILMPKFTLTLKALIGNKEKLSEMARTPLNKHCSAVLLKKLLEKLGDPGKFLIPCDFPGMAECLALADLDATINLMLFSVWKRLSLPDLTPTCMTLELADRSISHLLGVAEDVYVKVGSFHFLADFVVVDLDADPRVPLILEGSFLKTGRALIDVFEGELTLRVGKEAIAFKLDQTLRYFANYSDMTAKRIDVIDMACEEYSQEVLGEDKLSVIIEKDLSVEKKTALITVLKSHKRAIAWKLSDIKDQEKTTFTCPYGVFTYRRMPFRLCNAPGTFQRCMMAIFHDMIEKTMEVLMDDFSVFGNSFQSCLSYLERMLKRCEDTNLCLNWKKSHFMLKKGIVLGHKISKQWFEVDKAKIDVITKLTHPTTVKGAENQAAYHLSRLENPHQNVLDPKELNESFPLETLNLVSTREGVCLAKKPLISLRLAIMDLLEVTMAQITQPERKVQINELNELCDQAYENSLIYKEKTKRLHDSKIKNRVFNIGDRVLFFNSRLNIFSSKLKSRLSGLFTISQVYPYGTIELSQPDGPNFKVNGHRLKHYFGEDVPKLVVPDLQTFARDH